MIGISEAAIARATISSLKAHKSSSDPPPRQNDYISEFREIEMLQGRNDFASRAISLHFRRIKLHVNVDESAFEDPKDVPDGRSGG